MNWRRAALLLAGLVLTRAAAATPNTLSIYIEDGHAGSFYWLAEHLDLDQPCTLVHFDAHSDASGIFDSDRIRKALRQVSSTEERRRLLDQWRAAGAIQCFNWIEPLFPRPIAKIVWVPGETLNETERLKDAAEASRLFDGHLEAAPRTAGPVRDRYAVSDLAHLKEHLAANEPLVVTIDLDYFADLPDADQAEAFDHVWDFVIAQPRLRAVTFAISRPYLKSDAQADHLLGLALNAALSIPTAQIELAPFRSLPNDHSQRARDLRAAGKPLPCYRIDAASEELRARILSGRNRIVVADERARWVELLAQWTAAAPEIRLTAKGAQPSTDGVWRIPAAADTEVELVTQPWLTKPQGVEWFALVPRFPCCNVTKLSATQVGFVAGAAPQPAWREISIAHSGATLPMTTVDRFFAPNHAGSLRLRARAVVEGKVRETPVMEIRRLAGSGFRAAITEQFGLPYLFGSGELLDGTNTGPETDLGADCANFVVYALRRQGRRVPWSDPKQLRQYLELVASAARPGSVRITLDDLEDGLIIHLGSHVAAVMADREPLGVLDENDIVAHQLKGIPETLTLGELLHSRKQSVFDLYKAPCATWAASSNPQSAIPNPQLQDRLLFGGDIMLGRTIATRIENGIDPFAGLRDQLARATFLAANLECSISQTGQPGRDRRYSFRAPLQAATLLHDAGFRALSLANNHALDFGLPALRECAGNLVRQKIAPVGFSEDSGRPYVPQIFPLPNGRQLALFALNDVPPATIDRSQLAAALAEARGPADFITCLVHWGVENSADPTERQRELARWLVDHGADVVAGSHPHCLQPLDFYHGRSIAYSLGNLVFDGAPSVSSWNHGALLEIQFAGQARVASARLVPIMLRDGLPTAGLEPGKSEIRISKSETTVAK